MESKLFNLTTPLKIIVSITIITWCIIALFPLLWIVVMSIKLPVDSFASNPLKVIIGPSTKEQVGGLSFVNFIFLFLSKLNLISHSININVLFKKEPNKNLIKNMKSQNWNYKILHQNPFL